MKKCKVMVIDVGRHTSLVEYRDKNGRLQRKYIPRALTTSRKEVQEILCTHVDAGIEYSDVDFVQANELIGVDLLNSELEELQYILREYGLWRKNDFIDTPGSVIFALSQVESESGSKLDFATVLNLAVNSFRQIAEV